MLVDILILLVVAIVVTFAILKCVEVEKKNENILELKRMLSEINPQYGDIPIRISNNGNAYSVDKSIIYVPLKQNGTNVPRERLRYMTLHELAHILTSKHDTKDDYENHSEEFKEKFETLLREAQENGYDVE